MGLTINQLTFGGPTLQLTYFCDVVEFMRDEHERSQELKELFARFDALNGDEEELKAKKAKWAGSRVA